MWPYVKQGITFALWFTAPATCSASVRGSMFVWFDLLAKWSMIDVFVIITTIAAFRVNISSPELLFLPENLYQVDLLVVPVWGLYANMLAQILSQISSHYIIYCHRRIVSSANDALANEIKSTESKQAGGTTVASDDESTAQTPTIQLKLADHVYRRPHRGEQGGARVRWIAGPFVATLTACILSLAIAGCVLPSYSFDFQGLVGIAKEAGQGFAQAKDDHSVVSIATLLVDQGRLIDTASDKIGMAAIAVLLVLSTLIAPCLEAIGHCILWFKELKREDRARIQSMLEIVSAWSYIEVYLLSIVVGSWQVGGVSGSMVDSYCESLKGMFSDLVATGIINASDGRCFRVEAAIESAAYNLIVATALLAMLKLFVSKASLQYNIDVVTEQNQLTASDTDTSCELDSREEMIKAIRPVPVLFTDRFRWFLESDTVSRNDCTDKGTAFDKDSDDMETVCL
jgi:Paraquat-inducible protein A